MLIATDVVRLDGTLKWKLAVSPTPALRFFIFPSAGEVNVMVEPLVDELVTCVVATLGRSDSRVNDVVEVQPDSDHPAPVVVYLCASVINDRYPYEAPSKYAIGLSSRTFVW
jgi:hypothetical protein